MSRLPGAMTDISDEEITVTVKQLRELMQGSLEGQLAEISRKVCQEVKTSVQFSSKVFQLKIAKPKKPSEVSAHNDMEMVVSVPNQVAEAFDTPHAYQNKRPKHMLDLSGEEDEMEVVDIAADEGVMMMESLSPARPEPPEAVVPQHAYQARRPKNGLTLPSNTSEDMSCQPSLDKQTRTISGLSGYPDDGGLDWARRSYVTDAYLKDEIRQRPKLTWLGTPKWSKHRPALLPTSQDKGTREQHDLSFENAPLKESRTTPTKSCMSKEGIEPDAATAPSKLRFASAASEHELEHEHDWTNQASSPSCPSVVELRRIDSTFSLPDEIFERPFASIVLSQCFDFIAGLVVLLGTVFIGFKSDYLVQNPTWFVSEFEVVELFFCSFFLMEIALRLFVFRVLFFTIDGWEWNLLDLILTVYQVLQKICEYVLSTYRDDLDVFWQVNRPTPLAMYLRFLRFLRLLRLVRFGRLQVYIVEFRVMASSVLCSVRYLIWACVILSLVIYVCAVHFTLLVGRHAVYNPDDLADGTILHTHWGSLPRSMFSLFQAITGGYDWYLLVTPLMGVSTWTSAIFCAYICFTYLYIMNIITGVFVETAMEEAQEISEGNIVNELRDLFSNELNDDHDVQLTWEEFRGHLANKSMRRTFQALDLDVREAENLFTLLDMDGSGRISYDEFVTGCLRLRGNAKSIDVGTLMYESRRTKMWVQAIHEHILKISEHLDVDCETPHPLLGRSLKF